MAGDRRVECSWFESVLLRKGIGVLQRFGSYIKKHGRLERYIGYVLSSAYDVIANCSHQCYDSSNCHGSGYGDARLHPMCRCSTGDCMISDGAGAVDRNRSL